MDRRRSIIGKTVSHYRVVERVGEGGMGFVYKAEDTRLGRYVALKFLPEELASDRAAMVRFEREARAVSALNHPHICTVYDIGDDPDCGPFLVLEYLEGETLEARPGRPLRFEEIVAVGVELADALEAAHAKGIVHRDVKPTNIFITTRRMTKLLDFGIATSAAGGPSALATSEETRALIITEPGVAVGTVRYMSPEQVRGEPLDGRTDLFSLGVVLYEFATGRTPFDGATAGIVWEEILSKAPTQPVSVNRDVPLELQRIILKALEKDRDLRYRSATDLRVDLERLRREPTRGPIGAASIHEAQASLVVLPFENLSPDPENGFFSDGLTEEIIADLSKVRALRVISRTSAMTLRGARRSLPSIARDVNVRYVLEGSVRRAGNNLRITAQLIDATADTPLWAEKYTGVLDDVFDLQERLSRRIVEALKVTLTADEDRRLAVRPISNVRMLDCYLRARQEISTFTEDGLRRALRLVDQALELVGDNALLYATAALIHWQYHNAGFRVDDETLKQADDFASKALGLDADLSAGFLAKGSVAWTRGNLEEAADHLKRSVELDVNSDALFFLSYVYALVDQTSLARRYADEAIAVDPFNAWAHLISGWLLLLDGRADSATERFRQGLTFAPNDPTLSLYLPIALAYAGHHDQAAGGFSEVMKSDALMLRIGASVYAAALRGDGPGVDAVLASKEAMAYAKKDREVSWWVADSLARIGNVAEALWWLENSIQRGFVNHRFFSEVDPFMSSLRTDPSFVALMESARKRRSGLSMVT